MVWIRQLMDDVDRHHPCALTPTTARCTSALGAKLARARLLANSVKIANFLHGSWVLSAGAPEEIRTPDPQIRSLVLIRWKRAFVVPPSFASPACWPASPWATGDCQRDPCGWLTRGARLRS